MRIVGCQIFQILGKNIDALNFKSKVIEGRAFDTGSVGSRCHSLHQLFRRVSESWHTSSITDHRYDHRSAWLDFPSNRVGGRKRSEREQMRTYSDIFLVATNKFASGARHR